MYQMQCQGRRTPSMKASYVAMAKGSSDLTKELLKQEYSYASQPATPSVTTSDGTQARSQRTKK